MSVIIDIAKQVVTALNGNEFSMPFNAVFEPIPRTDLQSVKGLEVFVCPDSMRRVRESRSLWILRPVIQVGILKHIDKLNRVTEIENLVDLSESVSNFLGKTALENGRRVVEFNDSPLYFFDYVNQFSVFASVISAVYSAGMTDG